MSKGLTREEAYWARMSGEPIETPEPITKVTFTPSTFAQNSWCTTSTKMIIKGWILNDHL